MNGSSLQHDTTPLDNCRANLENQTTLGVVIIELLADGNVAFRTINTPPPAILLGSIEIAKGAIMAGLMNQQGQKRSGLALPPHLQQ